MKFSRPRHGHGLRGATPTLAHTQSIYFLKEMYKHFALSGTTTWENRELLFKTSKDNLAARPSNQNHRWEQSSLVSAAGKEVHLPPALLGKSTTGTPQRPERSTAAQHLHLQGGEWAINTSFLELN